MTTKRLLDFNGPYCVKKISANEAWPGEIWTPDVILRKAYCKLLTPVKVDENMHCFTLSFRAIISLANIQILFADSDTLLALSGYVSETKCN